jgi:ABC-type multidrug transport system permease subunit
MVTWRLAQKDLRLLVRDARAMVILLAMPLIFILVLGVSLGEGFGKKETLRVSVLNLDSGLPRFFDRPAMIREGVSWLGLSAGLFPGPGPVGALPPVGLAAHNHLLWFPPAPWSEVVLGDLAQSADISVELVDTLDRARELVRSGNRAAILVLGPNFSKRVERSSFLAAGWKETFAFSSVYPQPGLPVQLMLAACFNEGQDALPLYFLDGINPFHRDGVKFDELDVYVLRDPTQQTASAIIDQVAQGTLLRVVLPWMIGRAFAKIGDPEFIDLLSRENVQIRALGFRIPLQKILLAMSAQEKRDLGNSLQNAIQRLYSKYNLTAKTWAALTRSLAEEKDGAATTLYRPDGAGWLKFGAQRYQLLVPSYLVMFAFFLVLTVGWLFVAERRQGTLKRLCAAPLSRTQILAGKLLPCFLLSIFQGFFLLGAGKLIFGMSWGPDPVWLVPVVVTTSLAAMGLALLVAALARTETQVAIYGTLLVLVLAGLSGTMMGDRSLMPEQMQKISRFTPHAWALDAYRQLVANPGTPDLHMVLVACGILTLFGAGFVGLAWWVVKLD